MKPEPSSQHCLHGNQGQPAANGLMAALGAVCIRRSAQADQASIVITKAQKCNCRLDSQGCIRSLPTLEVSCEVGLKILSLLATAHNAEHAHFCSCTEAAKTQPRACESRAHGICEDGLISMSRKGCFMTSWSMTSWVKQRQLI